MNDIIESRDVADSGRRKHGLEQWPVARNVDGGAPTWGACLDTSLSRLGTAERGRCKRLLPCIGKELHKY